MSLKDCSIFKGLKYRGNKYFLTTGPELQKVGIQVSRRPDIFGGQSGHFQIVATNSSIIDQPRLRLKADH